MNIFKFEVKSLIKSTAVWTVSIASLFILMQSALYPVFYDSIDDVMKVIEGYPKEFLSAFGFESDTMFSFGGFFNLTYSYLSLMGAIMAAVLSITAFAREKRNKCSDFLLSKPCSRITVFFAKLSSVLTLLFVSNLIMILIALTVFSGTDDLDKLILCLIGLLFTEVVFIALGILFAIFAKKVRNIAGIATAFGFSAFILSALYGILNEEKMRYITPLKYFNPAAVYSNGFFETEYAVTAVILIISCIGIACYCFCKKDAHAV